MSKTHPVVFSAFGAERHVTVREAQSLIVTISEALSSIRVTCPTCRCRILPEQRCRCCASAAIDLDDDDRDLAKGGG